MLLLSTFASCAAMREDYIKRTCHYDGAYEKGMNDARADLNMNGEVVVSQCPEDKTKEIREGYRKGYSKGLSYRSKAIRVVLPENISE